MIDVDAIGTTAKLCAVTATFHGTAIVLGNLIVLQCVATVA